MANAYATASVLQFRERDHTETQSCFCSEGYVLHSEFNSVPSEVSRNISSGLRVRCLSQRVVLSDGIWVTFKHGISVNIWPWWALLRVAASAVSRFGSCGWTFLEPGGAVLGRQEGGCSGDRGSVRNSLQEELSYYSWPYLENPATSLWKGRKEALCKEVLRGDLPWSFVFVVIGVEGICLAVYEMSAAAVWGSVLIILHVRSQGEPWGGSLCLQAATAYFSAVRPTDFSCKYVLLLHCVLICMMRGKTTTQGGEREEKHNIYKNYWL